ncbi:MAG: RNA-directed DNA polymerase [Alphaproteobacteria bacterium]|nr:RNA-directed DNA polymerase [Alphaproteobacteria bacterium]
MQAWNSQRFRAGAKASGSSEETIQAAIEIAACIRKENPRLPVVFTFHHLSHLTDVSSEFLQDVAFRKVDAYRTFQLKKRGKPNSVPAPARRFRTISVPEPGLMRVQRWISQNILNVTTTHAASFAFTPKRDLKQAAMRHREAKWLVKMDITSFFESIKENKIYFVFRKLGYPPLLCFQMARICTRLPIEHGSKIPKQDKMLPYKRRTEGFLPQGAPTSPMLANLVAHALDNDLSMLAAQEGWIYTRYADDLSFSHTECRSRQEAVALVRRVESLLKRHGFLHNPTKTTISPPGARKIVLGLLVDREDPRLPKSFKNNLEAHLYALRSPKIGARAHVKRRGFTSHIGLRRHVYGLLAFAHHIEPSYAKKKYAEFNMIDWSA